MKFSPGPIRCLPLIGHEGRQLTSKLSEGVPFVNESCIGMKSGAATVDRPHIIIITWQGRKNQTKNNY
jgi:hypothetical protein